MADRTLSRLSNLVLILSHVYPRRRIPHALRRIHQVVTCSPLPATVSILPSTTGIEAPNETVDAVLARYAKQGNTREFESFISCIPSVPPTEHQRDLHVKAHVVNASLSTPSSPHSTAQRFPTGALAVLHRYEASGHFAPIQSYTRVISALFNVRTDTSLDPRLGRAAAQAQAWDLFAHMRYVAHPVPDAHLYALMIRACGSFSRPEPERALDLWTEMQENGMEPTKGAYEAVIRVCSRAGPEWLGEGMRLAREMSDRFSISDMNGRGLWRALLEGCKRAGDLKKARWILAEAVRGSENDAGSQDAMVDAELMTHMFHTYASYKPPFRREATRLVDHSVASTEVLASEIQVEEKMSQGDRLAHTSTEGTGEDDIFSGVTAENAENMPSFSRLPPQASSDIIAETRALFAWILRDRIGSLETRNHPQSALLVGRFARVELTPALLNAYLSVFYRHASIEASQEAFDSLFSKGESSGSHIFYPDGHTYANVLERCAMARVEDRHIAVRWAKDIWPHWEMIEANCLRDGKVNVGSFARLIEKAHAAMRRVLVLSGDIDGAQKLLRSFVSRYPPNAVLQPIESQVPFNTPTLGIPISSPSNSMTTRLFAKPPILSTRTILANPTSESSTARPLVRLTSAVSPKDDRVPPIVTFSDVDLLHARSVEQGRTKDIGYIKWVCLAYANALNKRRDAVLKAAPTSREVD